MLTALHHPLPLHTPKGMAWAVAMITNGPDHAPLWVGIVQGSGECRMFCDLEVRHQKN